MRLTRRGRVVVTTLAILLGLLLGLTAHLWNPYTRHLDDLERERRDTPAQQLDLKCFEDGWCGYCTAGALCDDSLDA